MEEEHQRQWLKVRNNTACLRNTEEAKKESIWQRKESQETTREVAAAKSCKVLQAMVRNLDFRPRAMESHRFEVATWHVPLFFFFFNHLGCWVRKPLQGDKGT